MDIELTRQLIQEYDDNKIKIDILNHFIEQLNKTDTLKEEGLISVANVRVNITTDTSRVQLNTLNTLDGHELRNYLIKILNNEKQALEDLNKQIENS